MYIWYRFGIPPVPPLNTQVTAVRPVEESGVSSPLDSPFLSLFNSLEPNIPKSNVTVGPIIYFLFSDAYVVTFIIGVKKR